MIHVIMRISKVCVAIILFLNCFENSYGAECNSPMCDGEVLHAIQTARLFEDSKTFVDMNLKTDPATVLAAFQRLPRSDQQNKTVLKKFLDDYFEGPGLELEQWTPPDYKERPSFLTRLNDGKLRQFGRDLCHIWSHLGRRIKAAVKQHPDRYSLIYLDKPFIVPGGRFREIYYWDTYWVVKGLLVCEMNDTVRGILENLIDMVKRFGLIPNGGRIYYTNRSQPPLLIPMVQMYVQKTGDTSFLQQNLQYLVQEYEFWNNHRSVMVPGSNYTLYRYKVDTTHPRPESYTADVETEQLKQDLNVSNDILFSDLASAAESGWDFSTRWLSEQYVNDSDKSHWLAYTQTSDVLPVDLNSIICWNQKILSEFYKMIGNITSSQYYEQKHRQTISNIEDKFWDHVDSTWYDVTISTGGFRKQFYPSNLFPMFVGCFDMDNKTYYDAKILEYIKQSKVLDYLSGVPTSTVNSHQQWDFPNAWPPLQDVVVTALESSHLAEAKQLAVKLVSNWVTSNLIGYQRAGSMFEKYVVTELGSRGSGGEYNVQEGFGWSNGVILDLLDRYGQNLTFTEPHDGSKATRLQYVNPALTYLTLVLLTFNTVSNILPIS